MTFRPALVPTLTLLICLAAAEDAPAPVAAEGTLVVQGSGDSTPITGTKTETPPLEQPQSLSVVDQELMRDLRPIKLEEAIRNVAGVTVGGYYNDWDYFRIRGFDAADNTRHDGLFATPGYWITPDVYGADRIEVLKGPASMLYGRSSLGGLVNLVSKKPKHDDFASVELDGGSESYAQLAADAGATFADDQVGIRVVALARNRGVYTEGIDDSQRFYFAPSATWWASDDTTVTLLGHFQEDDIHAAWPLPASGFITSNPNGDLPLDRNVGEPGFQNEVDNRRLAIGYELDHRFSEVVALRQNLRVSKVTEDFQGIYPDTLDADGRTLNRTVYGNESDYLVAQVDTMLDLRLMTGQVRHDVLIGVDLMQDSLDSLGTYAAIDPLDLYDPVYGARPGPFTVYNDSTTTSRSLGVYLQDQVAIGDRLTLIGGLRWDRIDTEETDHLGDTTSDSSDSAPTWRAAVTWLLQPSTSAFASYATSFKPQPYNTDSSGEVVDPETGNQIEAGLRAIDPGHLYHATVAVFQIIRENVATPDLSDPSVSVLTGEQRSRGFEFDGELKPVAGVSLNGTYAYIDAEVTKDNDLPVGDRLLNVPDHSVTAWLKYTRQEGMARGLGLGLGGRWYSDQAGDLPNTFDLPAYAILDAGLFFDRGPLSAQLNVCNLLDEEYAVGSYNDLYVLPGDPLSVRGSVSYTF